MMATAAKQLGFPDEVLTTAKTQAKWEKFLFEFEVALPCQPLLILITPLYPKVSKRGAPPRTDCR